MPAFRLGLPCPDEPPFAIGEAIEAAAIADPSDAGSMDVVGFDASAPAVMADFVRGPRERPAAAA